jgi:hypothetical protein
MREAVESRIIAKNVEIDQLRARAASLEGKLVEAGIEIPEWSKEGTEKDSPLLALHQGSP